MILFQRANSFIRSITRWVTTPFRQVRQSTNQMNQMRRNNAFTRSRQDMKRMQQMMKVPMKGPSRMMQKLGIKTGNQAQQERAETYSRRNRDETTIITEVGGNIEKYRGHKQKRSPADRRVMQYSQIHLVNSSSGERFVAHLGSDSGSSTAEMTINGVRLHFDQKLRGEDTPALLIRANPPAALAVDGQTDGQPLVLQPHSRLNLRDQDYRVEFIVQDDLGMVTPVQATWETSTGPIRQDNQDAIGIYQHPGTYLFAVADGVGGGYAGDRMSAYAIQYLLKTVEYNIGRAPRWDDLLQQAYQNANLEVRHYMQHVPQQAGTTLTAVLIEQWNATIAHVGDSRLYLLRRGKLHLMTQDHAKTISVEDEHGSRTRTILSRAIGRDDSIVADVTTLQLLPGDRLLLCTDGISNRVPPEEMVKVLLNQPLAQTAKMLVNQANARRNTDNASAIVIDILERADGREQQWKAEAAPRVYIASDGSVPALVGLGQNEETTQRSGGCLRWIVSVLVVALLVAGGWYLLNQRGDLFGGATGTAESTQEAESATTETPTERVSSPTATTNLPTATTVTVEATVTLRALPTSEPILLERTVTAPTVTVTQVFVPTSTLRASNQ